MLSSMHQAPQFLLKHHVLLCNITGACQFEVKSILIRFPTKTTKNKQSWLIGTGNSFLALFIAFLILLNTSTSLHFQDVCEVLLHLNFIQIRPLIFVIRNSRYSLQRDIRKDKLNKLRFLQLVHSTILPCIVILCAAVFISHV